MQLDGITMHFGDFSLFDVDGFFIGEGSLMENLGCGFVINMGLSENVMKLLEELQVVWPEFGGKDVSSQIFVVADPRARQGPRTLLT